MQRLEFLDRSRGFAILGIVILHIFSANPITIWISSYVVALFFILSGFVNRYRLLENKSLKEIFISRVKGLMIPYVLFCIINILSFIVFQGGVTDSVKYEISLMITLFGVGALWYLPALFVSEIMFIIINKNIKNILIKRLFISILFIIGLYSVSIYKNTYLYVFYRGLVGLGFIAIGYYSFDYIKDAEFKLISVIGMICLSFILSQPNGIIDIWSLTFNNKVLFIICSILGSLSVVLLFKNIDIKYLSYFGFNSLIIMSTHQMLMNIAKYVGITNHFLEFICVILLEVPIIYLVNKYLPCMLGRFKKREK